MDVETKPATDINESTAKLHGKLRDRGEHHKVDVLLKWREVGEEKWRTTDSPTRKKSGPFSAEIDGLENGKSYEFRAIAKADDMRAKGDILKFTKDEEEKKKPDADNDVQFEAKSRTDKRIKFTVHNDTKHDLKFSYTLKGTSTGGKVYVSKNDSEPLWVKYEKGAYTVALIFDGKTIATADGESAPKCNGD